MEVSIIPIVVVIAFTTAFLCVAAYLITDLTRPDLDPKPVGVVYYDPFGNNLILYDPKIDCFEFEDEVLPSGVVVNGRSISETITKYAVYVGEF